MRKIEFRHGAPLLLGKVYGVGNGLASVHVILTTTPTETTTLCGQRAPWVDMIPGQRTPGKIGRFVVLPEHLTCYNCQLAYAQAFYDPYANPLSPESLDMAEGNAIRNIKAITALASMTAKGRIKLRVAEAKTRLAVLERQTLGPWFLNAMRGANWVERIRLADMMSNPLNPPF